jgi:hypothetical protein
VGDSTVGQLLKDLARRAGIKKAVNPHHMRHSRITWSRIRGPYYLELGDACLAFWGKPLSTMINKYSHFDGLDTTMGEPKDLALPDVPAMPVPAIVATAKQVGELTARLEAIERGADGWIRERAKVLGLEAVLEAPPTPAAQTSNPPLSLEQKAEVVSRRARRARDAT